ncbi:hypothetical protein SB767_28210, partial [Bacillus sp. SIMBA_069]
MRQNEPSEPIVAANRAWLEREYFSDTQDFEDAERGFLGTWENTAITAADGRVVFDPSAFEFLTGDAPDSVNPSLWRQGTLIRKHGLFEVVDGIYQVRGFDLSVMSFIEG